MPTIKPILCILAGGRSSRFGSPKMSLSVAGVPIVSWLSRRVGAVCGQRWLSVAPGAALPPGAGGFDRIVVDGAGYAGPLPAMARVLSCAPRGSCVVFAAGDMPLASDELVMRLMRALRIGRRTIGVMSRWTIGTDAGRVEPMPSIWRAAPALRLIRRAMMRGVRGPHALVRWPGVRTIAIGGDRDRRMMANINHREDAAVLESIVATSK